MYDPLHACLIEVNVKPTDGSVVRLQGVFGARALFVYDPKALHHILIKDQHLFDHTRGFAM